MLYLVQGVSKRWVLGCVIPRDEFTQPKAHLFDPHCTYRLNFIENCYGSPCPLALVEFEVPANCTRKGLFSGDGKVHQESVTGWPNRIFHRKLRYFVCCLIDSLLKKEISKTA